MKTKTYEEKIMERRVRYNKSFKNSPHSPLLEEQKEDFKELEQFPIDEKYRITTQFIKNDNPEEIIISTSKEEE